MLRVLVVTTKGELGGAERWLIGVLKGATKLTPRVVVLDEGPLVAAASASGWLAGARPTDRSLKSISATLWWLRRIIDQEHPDVILLNSTKAGVLVGPWARIRGIPTVFVRHGSAFPRASRLVGMTSTAVIAVSPRLAEGLPAGRVRVILPARPDVRPEPRNSRGREDERRLRLVMLTRLVPEKGVDTAIRALAHLPRWELVVAGDTGGGAQVEYRRLEDLAARLGVSERVRFEGETESSTALLEQADAAAVLSRPIHDEGPAEGFGLVVVEAASAGIPVLADPEQVPSVHALGLRGVARVNSGDVDTVVAALTSLVEDEYRLALGEEGRLAAYQLPDARTVAELVERAVVGVAR